MSLKQTDLQVSSNSPASDCESTQSNPTSEWSVHSSRRGGQAGCGGGRGCRGQNYQWTDEQNRKYFNFLLKLRQRTGAAFPAAKIRRINIQMSRAVKSRTPIQCRSHNQKMVKRLGSLQAVIGYFEGYFARKLDLALPVGPGGVSDQLYGQNESLLGSEEKQQKVAFLWPITQWDLLYVLRPSGDLFSCS